MMSKVYKQVSVSIIGRPSQPNQYIVFIAFQVTCKSTKTKDKMMILNLVYFVWNSSCIYSHLWTIWFQMNSIEFMYIQENSI
jgi:hypothetical protein